mgnify:CR=1 FL=1
MPAGRKCPSHDPQCGCHGPIMSKGMVGWAGGSAGPDLFIYTASHSCAVGGCPVCCAATTQWTSGLGLRLLAKAAGTGRSAARRPSTPSWT